MAQATVEEIYKKHGHVVLRRARALLGTDADAREVVQDLFASLVARPEQFGDRSAVTTWLYSATTHLCLNRIRDARSRTRLLDERGAPTSDTGGGRPAEDLVLVRQLLARLPEDLATAAVYFHVDEMTHEEVARVMRCSRRHVGDLLKRLDAWAREETACTPS